MGGDHSEEKPKEDEGMKMIQHLMMLKTLMEEKKPDAPPKKDGMEMIQHLMMLQSLMEEHGHGKGDKDFENLKKLMALRAIMNGDEDGMDKDGDMLKLLMMMNQKRDGDEKEDDWWKLLMMMKEMKGGDDQKMEKDG